MLHPKLAPLANIHTHLAPGSVLPLHRLMWALAHGYVREVVAENGAKGCVMGWGVFRFLIALAHLPAPGNALWKRITVSTNLRQPIHANVYSQAFAC